MSYDFDNLINFPEPVDVKTMAEAEDIAIEWQEWAADQDLSYGELAEWQSYFIELAQRFPSLADEFRENAII